MSQQSPYAGPPLNVESWIERGAPGNRLTDKGGTGDVIHFEINHDSRAEEQWVREYAAGRSAFQDPRIEAARTLVDESPAEAVLATRIAREIPWRGSGFMYNQGVVRAMGMKDPLDQPHQKPSGDKSERDTAMDSLYGSVRQMHLAMQAAFGNPYEVKQELEAIAAKGREALKDDEINAWTAAVNKLGENGDIHAAGLGATELAAAYERASMPEEALQTYVAAGDLLKHRMSIVMLQGEPARHTAEVDVLAAHIVEAQSGVLRLVQAKDKVKGEDKELLKAAVYDLDDFGASPRAVMDGYKLLSRSSHFGEKRFYKKEAAGIAGNLAVAAFFEQNPGSVLMGGPEPRYDRSHLRPPVARQSSLAV